MSRSRPLSLTLAAALALFLLVGCDKNPTKPNPNPTGSSVNADSVLEVMLFDLAHSATNPSTPADINFTAAYEAYQHNLSAGDNTVRLRANLGVGVLGMMSVTQDPEVNAAFVEWRDFLAANKVPFRAPTPTANVRRSLGVSMLPGRASEVALQPFALVPMSAMVFARPSFLIVDPRLSRAQNILRTRVIPKLTQAIGYFNVVAADPSFTFLVTGKMQGDELETAIEIDHTDVLAMRAAAQLLIALCDVAVSYDVDFDAYTDAGIISTLSQGSAWMALTTTGRTTMADAQVRLLAAIDGADETIVSLLAETDSQDDDAIKRPPDPQGQQALQSARSGLQSIKHGLQSEITLTDDWDGVDATPPVPLRIAAHRLFTDPVPDWKALLPGYAVTVEQRSWDHFYHTDYGSTVVSLTAPFDGYYYGSCYISERDGQSSTYYFGDEAFRTPLTELAQERMQAIRAIPAWTGQASVYVSFSNNLVAGTQDVSANWSRDWYTGTTFVWVPVITWNAMTFGEWTWPDATFHGVLPGQTQSSFYQTFGVDGAGWRRQNVLDWTGAGPYSWGGYRQRPTP